MREHYIFVLIIILLSSKFTCTPRLFVPDIHLFSIRKWEDKCEGQLILDPIVHQSRGPSYPCKMLFKFLCVTYDQIYIFFIFIISLIPPPYFYFYFVFLYYKLFLLHPLLLIRTPYWSPSGARGKDYWFWYRLGAEAADLVGYNKISLVPKTKNFSVIPMTKLLFIFILLIHKN